MKLTNPPLTRGLGKTRSLDRRGKVPGTPSTQGLAQTVSIDSRVKPDLAQIIKEIGVRSVTHGELGEVTASSLIRFAATTTAAGADASIAIQVRATAGAAFEDAGIYLDANVSGLGGASRIRIEADNVVISDGSDVDPVFEFVGGQLFLRDVVLVTAIDDDVVATNHVQDDAITAIWTSSGDSQTTGLFATVNTTRTANTDLWIAITWSPEQVVDPTTAAEVTFELQVKRGGSLVEAFAISTNMLDAGGITGTMVHGGVSTSQFVDDDNVSGAQSYTFTLLDGSAANADMFYWRIIMLERKR